MAEKKPETKAEKKPDARGIDVDELGLIGHGIPAALGIGSLIAAVFSYFAKIQLTLTIALAVLGVLLPALAALSLLQRSRAAWSFLISLSIVLGVMTLFGSPKIRDLVGIHMSIALAIPVAFGIGAGLLSAMGDRYKI